MSEPGSIKRITLWEDAIFEVHVPDPDNVSIIKFYEETREVCQGHIRSNYGGWQKDVFPGDCAAIDNVLEKLNIALTNIFNEQFGIKKQVRCISAWLNANDFGASNLAHTHPGCHFSGVYYINAGDDDKRNGQVIFQRDNTFSIEETLNSIGRKNREPKNADPLWKTTCWQPPKISHAYLFAPYLQHCVTRNLSQFNRLVIGMNFRCVD